MIPTVILFDVDGVLVQPGGYRAAVQATVDYFTNLMGLGGLAPDADTFAIFEAQGITCEWDMVPLTLAIVLEAAAEAVSETLGADAPEWDSIQSAVEGLNRQPPSELSINFAESIRGLGRYVQVGLAPADAILQVCGGGQDEKPFPRLSEWGVLRELLSHTRRPQQSLTTQVFTTFSLGDQVYSQAMRLPALFRSESLLAKYDRPMLHEHLRDRLNHLQANGSLRMTAYTARPSLPDRQIDIPMAVFAPEAEMALKQVGLDALIIGSGQMGQAAWELGELEDRLTKPAPYHALAAVLAALTGSRPAALDWTEAAFRFFERGGSKPQPAVDGKPLPDHVCLHIFEDSPSGIQGGKMAVNLLSELGLEIDLHLWGVTAHPDKSAALRAAGANILPDVNQAVTAAGVV